MVKQNFSSLKRTSIIITCMALVFIVRASSTGEIVRSVPVKIPKTDTSKWPASFGLGRVANAHEIDILNIDIRPDGAGLPAGSGTISQGKSIYESKCASCHGVVGQTNPEIKTIGPILVSDTLIKAKTIGNYWPYASTVFDYIRRTMPYNAPGTLTDNEVYGLTAYLLNANKIIGPGTVLNASNLPKIKMPAQPLFIRDDRKGGREIK